MVESLSLVNLLVRDVQKSREFYCDLLEVPIANAGDSEVDKYLRLDIDGPQLYLHYTPPEEMVDYVHRGVEFYFRVADADAVAERLRSKGIPIRRGPFDLTWRPWRGIEVEDPDGYLIYLVSRRKDAAADQFGRPIS
jgi:catechol 2,3-dioxygenase-like lactoylglutathione lyase family enzyme